MTTADIYKILYIILGFYAVFVGYWLLGAGMFPRFTERAADAYEKSPVKLFLTGLVVSAVINTVGLILANLPPPAVKLLGAIILFTNLLLGMLGSAGLALRIGRGLRAKRDDEDPWRRVLRGGLVLGLTFIMPLLGWFGILPLVFSSGLGALIFCRRAPKAALENEPLPVSAAPAVSAES